VSKPGVLKKCAFLTCKVMGKVERMEDQLFCDFHFSVITATQSLTWDEQRQLRELSWSLTSERSIIVGKGTIRQAPPKIAAKPYVRTGDDGKPISFFVVDSE